MKVDTRHENCREQGAAFYLGSLQKTENKAR
jgi:hypothetical protein